LICVNFKKTKLKKAKLMSSMRQTSPNRKQIEQSIRKSAKRIIAASGIHTSTRKGNKELDFVVRQLAQDPAASLAIATTVGETLGQKIVELSRQRGKTHLDRGVIYQLVVQNDLPVVTEAQANQLEVEVQAEPLQENEALKDTDENEELAAVENEEFLAEDEDEDLPEAITEDDEISSPDEPAEIEEASPAVASEAIAPEDDVTAAPESGDPLITDETAELAELGEVSVPVASEAIAPEDDVTAAPESGDPLVTGQTAGSLDDSEPEVESASEAKVDDATEPD
jgi:hypothetical protein